MELFYIILLKTARTFLLRSIIYHLHHLQQPVHTPTQIIIGVPTTEFRQVFNLYTISYPYLKSRKRVYNEYKIQIIHGALQ